MSLNADFPAERGVEVPDFSEHGKRIFYLKETNGNPADHKWQNWRSRGIIINRRESNPDDTYCSIVGCLWDEDPRTDMKRRRLVVGVEHPRAYRAIDLENSDAEGIEINA